MANEFIISGRPPLKGYEVTIGGYHISDVDESSDPKYYGFVDKDGGWYIMEENTANGTYRYIKGSGDYTTNWTNRASLTYDYYFNVF